MRITTPIFFGLLILFLPKIVFGDLCLKDATGLSNPSCTANDLQTAIISKVTGPSTCVDGTTIYVQLRAETTAGSSQRYDIGYFISLDGGDAKEAGGTCYRDYLPPPLNSTPYTGPGNRTSPFYSIPADADQCGDPEQSKTLLRNIGGTTTSIGMPGPPTILAFPCADLDGVGPVLSADIGVCTSWDNQASNNCTSVANAKPGTGAKCSCQTVKISGIIYKATCGTDADCDDGSLCTSDSCNTSTGDCINTAIGPNTPCNDHNPCTDNDVCGGAGNLTCLGTTKTCPGDQCHDEGICDFATGLCNNPNKTNGTSCNDGQDCTSLDVCTNGVCLGTDTCELPLRCMNGVCELCGTNADCDDNNPCTDDTCNESTGCSHAPNANPCDDGDTCTTNDQCSLGSCQPGTPIVCDSPGTCQSSNGTCLNGICSYSNVSNGTSCDDLDLCTKNDVCTDGNCSGTIIPCSTPGICETGAGTCFEGACTYQNATNGTFCDDLDLCTENDFCTDGNCTPGSPLVCNTPGICQNNDGICANGQCTYTLKPDNIFCGEQMVCQTGVCVFVADCATGTDCPTLECLEAGCTDGSCVYSFTEAQEGASCGANAENICHNGTCVQCINAADCPGTNQCNLATCTANNTCAYNEATCNGGSECTFNSCDPNLGCIYSPCNDFCDGGDQCNVPVCNINDGCAISPLSDTPCTDNNACTAFDTCSAGQCVGNTVVCDAPDTCSTAACDPNSGQCLPSGGCLAPTFCDNQDPVGSCIQCNERYPCFGTLVCVSGICVGCQADENCVSGDECVLGQCVDNACEYHLKESKECIFSGEGFRRVRLAGGGTGYISVPLQPIVEPVITPLPTSTLPSDLALPIEIKASSENKTTERSIFSCAMVNSDIKDFVFWLILAAILQIGRAFHRLRHS